ncbi:MAG: Hsp70 family protein, partial [Promethearchaeota archaeon]
EEIQRKIHEAETHADEDEKIRKNIELRNEADGMAFQAKKLMEENADKLDEDLKNNLVKAMDEVNDAVKSDDMNRIKTAKDELEKHLHKLAEKIYAQGGAPGGAPGGMGGMGGMTPEQAAQFAQQAAQAQKGAQPGTGAGYSSQGGATYDTGKKKKKKKVVDVDWEEE